MSDSSPTDRSLTSKGFLGLLITQLLGAMNDNLLKGVLSFAVGAGGVWADQLGKGGQSYVGLCLSVPFILLSGFSGQLADRYSKQSLALILKGTEIAIAAVALVAFLIGNLWLALIALVMLATHSAFFGPVKYGMIPELVGRERLSPANGIINLSTNIAVILGTLLSGKLYSIFHPEKIGEIARPIVPGMVLVLVAILGFMTSMLLPKLKAMDPQLKIKGNPFAPYWEAISEMRKTPLLAVTLAWAFFYLIGMLALMILVDYRDLLHVTPEKASVLLGVLGIAIGIGSAVAGAVSGSHIKPRLIPMGAAGMTLFFVLLGTLKPDYNLTLAFLLGAGISAGFYIVPLQSLLQYLSPENERGRFLGTANAISFVASSLSALIYLAARKADLEPNHIFLICAGLTAPAVVAMLWKIRSLIAAKVIE
jgi:MFS family permease